MSRDILSLIYETVLADDLNGKIYDYLTFSPIGSDKVYMKVKPQYIRPLTRILEEMEYVDVFILIKDVVIYEGQNPSIICMNGESFMKGAIWVKLNLNEYDTFNEKDIKIVSVLVTNAIIKALENYQQSLSNKHNLNLDV